MTDEPTLILADKEISYRARAPHSAFGIRPHDGGSGVSEPISMALTDLNLPYSGRGRGITVPANLEVADA